MTSEERKTILKKAKEWFKECIGEAHLANTEKLTDPEEFNINPFTFIYLANYLTGNSDKESIAKALIYPRVLGTSITTSFGNGIQKFTSSVLDGFASTTAGIDIEFVDQVDGRRKYCQLKAGPNTINKDDVESIAGHFQSVKDLARTNNLNLQYGDLVVGVVYGKSTELNGHYKRISKDYDAPVFIGQEFWKRLTGDDDFYVDIIQSVGEVATEADYSHRLEEIITELAANIDICKITNDD